MEKCNILVLTDLHYIGKANHTCTIERRKVHLAPKLLETVFQQTLPASYDVIALVGDVTDNGNAAGATEDLIEIKTLIEAQGKPVLAVRGNHDAQPEVFQGIFRQHMNPLECNGYRLMGFSDFYQPGVAAKRNWMEMEEAFRHFLPGMPAIVFQHSPVYPPIEDEYPYNIEEAEKLMAFYRDNHVLLSVSGHLHSGYPLTGKDGVHYITAAALCEPPFQYAMIRLDGGTVTYEQYPLPESFK